MNKQSWAGVSCTSMCRYLTLREALLRGPSSASLEGLKRFASAKLWGLSFVQLLAERLRCGACPAHDPSVVWKMVSVSKKLALPRHGF